MKKTLLIAFISTIALTACKKDGNKGVIKSDSVEFGKMETPTLFDESKTYTYIAENGNRANVSYQNEGNDHTMTINANNMKYVLDKKDGDANSQMYERNSVEVKVTRDSLHIMQDNTVIPMRLEK